MYHATCFQLMWINWIYYHTNKLTPFSPISFSVDQLVWAIKRLTLYGFGDNQAHEWRILQYIFRSRLPCCPLYTLRHHNFHVLADSFFGIAQVGFTLVVLTTLFQFSDWIVTRYLDVFQPKETEFGVKNIKRIWDRAPPWPWTRIFRYFCAALSHF